MKIFVSFIYLILGSLGVYFYYDIYDSLIKLSPIGWILTEIGLRIIVIALITKGLFDLFRLLFKKLNSSFLLTICVVFSFVISFIRPIYIDDYGISKGSESLINETFKNSYIDNSEISKGYSVVAFFTTSCPFCKAACYNFSINASKGKQPNTMLFFPGTKEDSDAFMQAANSSFPYTLINDQKLFTDNSGYSFPSVYLLKDGEVLYHWVGSEINYSVLDYLSSLAD